MMQPWKKMSPRSISETVLRVPKLQVQMVLESCPTYCEGWMYTSIPSKMKEKMGQLGVSEHLHSGVERELSHPWKKLLMMLLNNSWLRQKQLVPESMMAILAEEEVMSTPPTVTPSTLTCQYSLPTTGTYLLLFCTERGSSLKQMKEGWVEGWIMRVKADVWICWFWQATSRKLGVVVYPIPTNPCTWLGKFIPLYAVTQRYWAVILMGVLVIARMSVPKVPDTPDPSAYCTPPGLLVLVKVDDLEVLKKPVGAPDCWVGSQRVLLPVSNWTPICWGGVPTYKFMQQMRS